MNNALIDVYCEYINHFSNECSREYVNSNVFDLYSCFYEALSKATSSSECDTVIGLFAAFVERNVNFAQIIERAFNAFDIKEILKVGDYHCGNQCAVKVDVHSHKYIFKLGCSRNGVFLNEMLKLANAFEFKYQTVDYEALAEGYSTSYYIHSQNIKDLMLRT